MAKALTASPSTIRRRRKKWLEALRSGEFKQAKSYLKKKSKGEMRYCCLGVAAEMCGVPNQQGYQLGSGVFRFDFQNHTNQFTESQMLPQGAQEWLGLNTDNPRINTTIKGHGDEPVHITGLNDDGWSFAKIADLIEEHGFAPGDDLLKAEGREYAEKFL